MKIWLILKKTDWIVFSIHSYPLLKKNFIENERKMPIFNIFFVWQQIMLLGCRINCFLPKIYRKSAFFARFRWNFFSVVSKSVCWIRSNRSFWAKLMFSCQYPEFEWFLGQNYPKIDNSPSAANLFQKIFFYLKELMLFFSFT